MTTKLEHTPGPWKVADTYRIVRDAGEPLIALAQAVTWEAGLAR
jgi:hypothetical protein